jgi:hypothetical protein
MAAYLIADIEVHDPQAYEEYKQKASSTVKQFGGLPGSRWRPRHPRGKLVANEARPAGVS